MNEVKKIKANLNPKFEIRERDQEFPHVRFLYKHITNPADPINSIETKEEIRPLRWNDYERIFPKKTEDQIKVMKVIGASEMELVHLPGAKVSKSDKKTARDSELKFKEGRRTATVADIERIMNGSE